MILELCKSRYYSQTEYDETLSSVQHRIYEDVTNIENEMFSIFYDFLHTEPYYYWDKEIFQQTVEGLENIHNNYGTVIAVTEDILEHFLFGLHTYRQAAEIINDLRTLNDNPELKTRLYRIPTYNSVVEGCLSNLYRVIALILNQTTEKDYKSQNKLNPLCDILRNNKFDLLVRDVNVDIRNAINHGGVFYKIVDGSPVVEFQYVKNRQPQILHIPMYEFDVLIDKVLDTASAILLGLTVFFNNHKNLLDIDLSENTFIPFSLLALKLSIPDARCRSISGLPNNKQLNIDMYIKNTDRGYLHQIAVMISLIVYDRYSDYEQYMISFSNERLQSSWVRFTNSEVRKMLEYPTSIDRVVSNVIERGGSLIWPPSTEEVDLNEIKYFRFPNYKNKLYSINRVEDASIGDRKRLKAHLYIGDMDNRNEIINIIREAINWVNKLKNPASPTLPIKHGDMEADSVYLNVYRKDTRKNKSLLPNNRNFVCKVDYNIDGKTTLRHGGIPESIWNQLSRESFGNMRIAWRDAKYRQITKEKTGRNDPCPCRSGKKYKKCCLVG